MRARDALYSFAESVIASSTPADPLHQAEPFRNLRTPVDEAEKVVRIEVFDGMFVTTPEESRKEIGVKWTAQFWVIPKSADGSVSQELADIDAAADKSFEMARQFFDAMRANQSLSGEVCLCDGDEFETGTANLGAMVRGVTYLDGEINPIGMG